MKQLSTRFEELWSNQTRSLNVEEYMECLDEWQRGNVEECNSTVVVCLLLWCAGFLALYLKAIFVAVFLLALVVHFELRLQTHTVIIEIMKQNKLLAMLINRQSQDLVSLRGASEGS